MPVGYVSEDEVTMTEVPGLLNPMLEINEQVSELIARDLSKTIVIKDLYGMEVLTSKDTVAVLVYIITKGDNKAYLFLQISSNNQLKLLIYFYKGDENFDNMVNYFFGKNMMMLKRMP